MFITATIPTTVSAPRPTSAASWTPRNGNVNVCTQTPKPTGIAAASTWPASFSHQREAAEVVDRADRRRDRGAEQDAAHLAVERQERERRDEDAEEEREPAEPRHRRTCARSPSCRRSTTRASGPPPTAGVRSTTIASAISAPQTTCRWSVSSIQTIAAAYFVP